MCGISKFWLHTLLCHFCRLFYVLPYSDFSRKVLLCCRKWWEDCTPQQPQRLSLVTHLIRKYSTMCSVIKVKVTLRVKFFSINLNIFYLKHSTICYVIKITWRIKFFLIYFVSAVLFVLYMLFFDFRYLDHNELDVITSAWFTFKEKLRVL